MIFNVKNLSKKNFLKNINLGATFLFLSILCSIKIEQLLFLKFLKNLAFFDSYFRPFNKTHEKIIAIYVISAIIASIWNVFIKFRWHDKKFTDVAYSWALADYNCIFKVMPITYFFVMVLRVAHLILYPEQVYPAQGTKRRKPRIQRG